MNINKTIPMNDILFMGENNPGGIAVATDIWVWCDMGVQVGFMSEKERELLWFKIHKMCKEQDICGPKLWKLFKDNGQDVYATISALILGVGDGEYRQTTGA